MNNSEFLQGLRDQDPAAIQHLTECYLPSVWRYVCAKVGNDQHLAEDIVSESVLALIRAAADETQIEHPGAWLRTVALRRVQDHFRAAARVRHLIEQVQHVAPTANEDDAVKQQLLAERRDQVVDVMDQLSPEHRMALEWKYIDKLSVREIAARMEATEKSVEALLFRARGRFKKMMAAKETPCGPDALTGSATKVEQPNQEIQNSQGENDSSQSVSQKPRSQSLPRASMERGDSETESEAIRQQRLQTGFGRS